MNAEPLRRTVTILNPQGLHMRPMQAFVETASRFQCRVRVGHEGKELVDGRSMIMLLGLAAEAGAKITVEVDGPDAAQALAALAEVLERTYD
jgi:phosphocarrier protein